MYRSDILVRRNRSDVIDGLTNTLMIGEDVPQFDRWCSWPYSNNAYSTCAIPLNVRPVRGSNYAPSWWPNVQSFRSRHPGGGNFAWCDGSVRFMTDSIDLSVYRAAATIAGRETGTP
jgi:prepilin-type processing-associated H-X9-DG protein